MMHVIKLSKEEFIVNNFTFYNPTKLIFGKDQLEQLKTEASHALVKDIISIRRGSANAAVTYDRCNGCTE